MMGDDPIGGDGTNRSSSSPREELRKLYAAITRFSDIQVRTFSVQFVKETIFTPEEDEFCKTGQQLAQLLWGRSEDQIELALKIIDQCPVTRTQIHPTSNLRKATSFSPSDSSQITLPSTPEETNLSLSTSQSGQTSTELVVSRPSSEQLDNGDNSGCSAQEEQVTLLQKGQSQSVSNGTQQERKLLQYTMALLISVVITACICIPHLVTSTGHGQPIRPIPADNNLPPQMPNNITSPFLEEFGGNHSVINALNKSNEVDNLAVTGLGESPVDNTSPRVVRNNINATRRSTIAPSTPSTFQGGQEKELTLLKNVFYHENMTLYYLDSVDTLRFVKTRICNKTVKKALELVITSPFDHSDFQMPCVGSLNGLLLSGNMTIQNVHQILISSPNIEFLTLNAQEVCPSVDYHWGDSIDPLEKVVLPKLRYLKISNFGSECSDLVQLFDEKLSTPNVQTIVLESFNVEEGNLGWVENMISANHSQLEAFSYSGRLCSTCELYQHRVFNKSLKAVNFKVENDLENIPQNINHRNIIGLTSIKNIIGNSGKTLQYFVSNVELPRIWKLFNFGFLESIRVMDMTLGLPKSVSQQVSAQFLSLFPHLSELSVELKFNNRDSCKSFNFNETVKVTNLNKYVESTRISKLVIKAKCRLDAVKGWDVFCRDYSTERLNNNYYEVVLSGTDKSRECSRFWNSSQL